VCVYSHEPGTGGFGNVKGEITGVASGSQASRLVCRNAGRAVGGTLRTDDIGHEVRQKEKAFCPIADDMPAVLSGLKIKKTDTEL